MALYINDETIALLCVVWCCRHYVGNNGFVQLEEEYGSDAQLHGIHHSI